MQNLNQVYPIFIRIKKRKNSIYTQDGKEKREITAGKAKKLIPTKEHIAAINLPIYDEGTLSPYPTVHNVICKNTKKKYEINELIITYNSPP